MPNFVVSIPKIIDGLEVKYTIPTDTKSEAIARFKQRVSEQYPHLVVKDDEIVVDFLK